MLRKIQRNIENMLVWLLCKINRQRFNKIDIGKRITIDFGKLIPDDNKWHHLSFSVDYWLRHGSEGKKEVDNLTLHVDGDLKHVIKE